MGQWKKTSQKCAKKNLEHNIKWCDGFERAEEDLNEGDKFKTIWMTMLMIIVNESKNEELWMNVWVNGMDQRKDEKNPINLIIIIILCHTQ